MTRLVYPSAPTRCGAHLPPSLLIAYPSAPPKRGEAPCQPDGAHAKCCPLPPLLFSAYAHRPASQKRRSALSSRRRPRETARINRCPYQVPSQRRPQMRRSALSTWQRSQELAPSTAAPLWCPHFGASQKRRNSLSSRWRPREAAPICLYPCLVPTHWCLQNAAKRPIYR